MGRSQAPATANCQALFPYESDTCPPFLPNHSGIGCNWGWLYGLQTLQPRAAAFRDGYHICPPPQTRHIQIHAQVGDWKIAATALGPFHQPEGGFVAVESEEFQFAAVTDAVEIEVPGLATRRERIALHQRVGGAANGARHAQRAQQRAGERGLPGAEVAMQVEDTARRARARKGGA